VSARTVEDFAERLVDQLVGEDAAWPEPVARERRLALADRILAAGRGVVARLRGVDPEALAPHDGHVDDEREVVITVGGERAFTTAQAAADRGMTPSHLRTVIWRAGLEPVGHIDARTPLWRAEDLDRAFESRPGQGAAGRPKPRKSGGSHSG
jgi:hypothetical protein